MSIDGLSKAVEIDEMMVNLRNGVEQISNSEVHRAYEDTRRKMVELVAILSATR